VCFVCSLFLAELSGHIDSWDVGQGAMDDGGGVLMALEAAKGMIDLGLKPKRTIRCDDLLFVVITFVLLGFDMICVC
jgi:hypothetical protein